MWRLEWLGKASLQEGEALGRDSALVDAARNEVLQLHAELGKHVCSGGQYGAFSTAVAETLR